MKIHKGDKVKIISGKQKGTESVVEKVYKENNKILVENVNIVTKHAKPTANTAGGLLKVNRPINVSNAMVVCPKCSKSVRIGYKFVDGKKFRVCKKCNEVI
ncbi:50S ribosomal protein L24 [candidate division WWE3 bacterium CG_4_9_14_0_2_um_filter_35_11]|uniref:Large ribosomal subunit protein uL24 n=1 Tax=candidate division WWE3 bacterium CG_4_9_14_0_2_um_filter_35_11 TaxID=1975077 RepID=A0A2M8EL52_UNCKA|nr:MAG: 50S ribosomal protein L24 [candidate division WWE3 bacterium CG10_big_fil_rev_8_21_14_0_10_35_32]PJC23430.1 MAG: 50S ribosomal protein L24 [candidate division WWE3 bacterium CG_4_9_14_0_2_um_filter_35_11]